MPRNEPPERKQKLLKQYILEALIPRLANLLESRLHPLFGVDSGNSLVHALKNTHRCSSFLILYLVAPLSREASRDRLRPHLFQSQGSRGHPIMLAALFQSPLTQGKVSSKADKVWATRTGGGFLGMSESALSSQRGRSPETRIPVS